MLEEITHIVSFFVFDVVVLTTSSFFLMNVLVYYVDIDQDIHYEKKSKYIIGT